MENSLDNSNLLIAVQKNELDKMLSALLVIAEKIDDNAQKLEAANRKIELRFNFEEQNQKQLEGIKILFSADIMKCLGIGKTKFHQIKHNLPFLRKDGSNKIFAFKNDLIEYIKTNYPEPYYENTKKLLTNTE